MEYEILIKQSIDPSKFDIRKLAARKRSIVLENAFNLDFFGGSPMYSVCNLAAEGKIISQTATLCGSSTSGKAQTTLLVFDDGSAVMEKTAFLTKYENLRCAIGGMPLLINGREVSLSRDIRVQGWSGNNMNNTLHGFLTVQNGYIWYIAAEIGSSSAVRATTIIADMLKSIGCTGTVIKLDGGGSFIFKRQDMLIATSGNRTINYIGTWQ